MIWPTFRPPDGSQILFQGHSPDGLGLYVIDKDGSNLRALVGPARGGDTYDFGQSTWSPNGTRIVYKQAPPGTNAYQLFVMNADGTGVREIAREAGMAWSMDVVWSPDSTRILYLRWPDTDNPGEYSPLAVADVDGGGAIEVGPPLPDGGQHFWSPDGSTITQRVDGHTYLVDPDTGDYQQVTWGPPFRQFDDYADDVSALDWQRVAP